MLTIVAHKHDFENDFEQNVIEKVDYPITNSSSD